MLFDITPKRALSSTPIVLLVDGRPVRERMRRNLVDDQDILSSPRELHGLERLEQIKFAILETSGSITIVPKTN